MATPVSVSAQLRYTTLWKTQPLSLEKDCRLISPIACTARPVTLETPTRSSNGSHQRVARDQSTNSSEPSTLKIIAYSFCQLRTDTTHLEELGYSGFALFIIARRAQQGGGPPVAVKKVVSPTFPLSFSLSDSDMMMGGVWPEQVWLEARLDSDGNAMTKEDADWNSQRIGPLTSGSTEGILVLEN